MIEKCLRFFFAELLHFAKLCDIVQIYYFERVFIVFKRWMALVLAAVMVLSLAACGGKNEEETTKNNDKEVVATDDVTNDAGETEDTAVETEENGETKENKEDKEDKTEEDKTEKEDKTTKKSEDEKDTTMKKDSDKTTTKKTSSDKTTTKKEETFKIPSGKSEIVNAYKKAANRTKAQDNMSIEKTCDVDINIEKFANKAFTALAKSVASFFMNQASGAVEKETFKNGKPTKNTEKKNGVYINDRSTYIPLYGKKEMCTLDPANVKSAEVTKKGKDSYDVKIVLKDDKCDINGIPKITFSGMDYFNPSLYTENLKGINFAKGTVYYTECVIIATVNADGYLDYVKHDMKLKTNDTVIELLGVDIDAALSGRYVTTFKFI